MKIASTVWEEVPFFIENKKMNLLSSDKFWVQTLGNPII
jgi:hypothetical protein